jgi:hypothetical protein
MFSTLNQLLLPFRKIKWVIEREFFRQKFLSKRQIALSSSDAELPLKHKGVSVLDEEITYLVDNRLF